MEYRIAVIPGDGIGPEIVTEAKKLSLIHISFRWKNPREGSAQSS